MKHEGVHGKCESECFWLDKFTHKIITICHCDGSSVILDCSFCLCQKGSWTQKCFRNRAQNRNSALHLWYMYVICLFCSEQVRMNVLYTIIIRLWRSESMDALCACLLLILISNEVEVRIGMLTLEVFIPFYFVKPMTPHRFYNQRIN